MRHKISITFIDKSLPYLPRKWFLYRIITNFDFITHVGLSYTNIYCCTPTLGFFFLKDCFGGCFRVRAAWGINERVTRGPAWGITWRATSRAIREAASRPLEGLLEICTWSSKQSFKQTLKQTLKQSFNARWQEHQSQSWFFHIMHIVSRCRHLYSIEKGDTTVIICICERHESTGIENRYNRVKKSIFEK